MIADSQMLHKYLSKSTSYFEWGSGDSTISASEYDLERCISVESDKVHMEKIKQSVGANVTFVYVDMGTEHKTWGYPSEDCKIQAKQIYSSQLADQVLSTGKQFDLILVDGRFRVACCLKSFSCLDENAVVLFDDFDARTYYHVVLKYYDILETGKQMFALTKKVSAQPPSSEEIQKFETDAR